MSLLWHGLPTVPPPPTEGLPVPMEEETFGRERGTVRRPCHNEGGSRRGRSGGGSCHGTCAAPLLWHGLPTVPPPPTEGLPVPTERGDLRSGPWHGRETIGIYTSLRS